MGKAAQLLVIASIVATVAPTAAGAAEAPSVRAADDLSTPVTFTGSGDTSRAVRTSELRDLLPPSNPRILVLGTGVARGLFPTPVAAVVSGVGNDLVDPHGYGTLAASTILQLSPGARITSKAIRSADRAWHLIDLDSLAAGLESAFQQRDQQDAILLAFPPNGALDPMANLIGHADYGAFGKGDGLLAEALLAARAPVQTRGIPTDRGLRDEVFDGLNDRQRDAVERYVSRAKAWDRVTAAIRALTDAGVAVVAPTGDFTRKASDGSIVELPHQTIYGVAALPEVITVGAAYTDAPNATLGRWRVSPTSGRGPTLSLDAKPDLLAPGDVVGMLPASSGLAWPDDSTRTPGSLIAWAQPGVTPSTCPSPTGAYRCVLQASSMVAAAIVATNLAASVNRGAPNFADNRSSADDEILRGIAWSAASSTPALASKAAPSVPAPNGTKPLPANDRTATLLEQGTGVMTGLAGFDPAKLPVALSRAVLGEVAPSGAARQIAVPIWKRSAKPATFKALLTDRLAPDPSGRAVSADAPDGIVSASTTPSVDPSLPADQAVRLTAPAAMRAGGLYHGVLKLKADGPTVAVPAAFVQTLPFDFHADYAYNELMADGLEGERVEDASVILMAGLPAGIGLVGEAFKSLSGPIERRMGGDPAHNIILRTGRAKNTFADPGLAPGEHGRGRIPAVPPGFYRFHLLSDQRVEAKQEDGTLESLGIGLGSFGPDGFSSPAHNILIAGNAPCSTGAAAPCLTRDPLTNKVDERTGFCEASNPQTKVRFGIYCDEVAYAVPSAVVTRAVHLFERAEWEACSVALSADGSLLSMTKLLERAEECGSDQIVPLGGSAPSLPGTAWKVDPGSPSCLAPSERSAFPGGHPSDMTARFGGASGVMTDKLPSLVLTTQVPLPYLNTYTTATLTMAYEAEGAVVAARFDAGPDRNADASHSIFAVAGSGIEVPGGTPAAPKGIYEDEWSIMSANQPTARLSLMIFPTNPGRSAQVALCDVALRVSTFAKQAWGDANGSLTRTFPMLDRGLGSLIDPNRSRIRAAFNGSAFSDLMPQRESVVVATHVPRNTTRDRSSANRVRSPIGGPASLVDVRRWGTDARAHEKIAGVGLIDAKGGSTSLACTSQEPTCQAWQQARSRGQLLAELSPDLVVNGRFFGYSVARDQQLTAAAGNLAYSTRFAFDDGGTTPWGAGNRVIVSDFPTRGTATATAGPLDPVVQVLRDPAGRAVLRILGTLPGGSPMSLATV